MLTLIGLGLFDEKDMSLRGLEEAKDADSVYIELYTSDWQGSIPNLEKMVGKPIKKLDRAGMEEHAHELIREGKTKKVAVLIPGDPLVATTHSMILLDARKEGVVTKIIHASSVYSALAETGLHIYKFGRTVTLPARGVPQSMLDVMKENKERGLHTLVLSDIGLPFPAAAKMLSEHYKEKIIVVSQLGGDTQIRYEPIERLIDSRIKLPFIMIVPGKMHFSEEDVLNARRTI